MDDRFFVGLAILLFLALIIDIGGHIFLHIKRRMAGWVLLGIVFFGCLGSMVFCVRSYSKYHDKNDGNLYAAYTYLEEGKLAYGVNKNALVADEDNVHHRVLDILFGYAQEDYQQVYFSAQKALEDKQIKKKFRKEMELLLESSEQKLGITEAGEEEADFEWIVSECKKKMGLSKKETVKYERLYELDESIQSGNYNSTSIEEIAEILKSNKFEEDILKSAIQYAMSVGSQEQGEQWAWMLASKYPSEQNDVIYTDVVTENALAQTDDQLKEDEEAGVFLEQAQEKEKKAAKLEEEDKKQQKLMVDALNLRKQAKYVKIRKAQNYLDYKKPLLSNNQGLYDLQQAKLCLAMEERDKAKQKILEVIDQEQRIAEDSPIRKAMTKVVDAYNQSKPDNPSPQLQTSSHELIRVESQDIIPLREDTVNGKMADYVASTLKYSKIGIHIGKIDTSQYPKVTAYCNINGEYNNATELVTDLQKEDFELVDTQYEITDFKMNINNQNTGSNIALVIDRSGSMSGVPLENAKEAARACIANLSRVDQKISLVTYNTEALENEGLTEEGTSLQYALDGIQAEGGTNISGGIEMGLQSLGHASGGKAIILLSDGQDGNSKEAMEKAVKSANIAAVPIYTVGLGDVDQVYLASIAEATGGKFIMADSSVELQDIYLNLQKYIINNYSFTYEVKKNAEVDPRNLMVAVEKYQASSNKDYTIADGIVENENDTVKIEKADENALSITAVTPGAASASAVRNGMEIEVSGTGFREGMRISIGNLLLEDVEIKDSKTAKGKLKGDLYAGEYQLRASFENGVCALKPSAFFVYRAGTTQTAIIGKEKITADQIGQVSDNTFVASGNVMMNGFLHSSGVMKIQVDSLDESFSLDSDAKVVHLGESGEVSGDGKLYISYKQVGGGDNLKKKFASLVLAGNDYVVTKGEAYAVVISGEEAALALKDLEKELTLDVPCISKLTAGSVNVYSDRLRITVNAADITDIKDKLGEVFGGTSSKTSEMDLVTAAKAKNKDEGEQKSTRWKLKDNVDLTGYLTLTSDDILLGAKVKVDTDDMFTVGNLGLGSITVSFDTGNEEQKYWSISAGIDLAKMVPFFHTDGALGGFKIDMESYQWYPNTFGITLELADHVQPNIANVLFLNSIGVRAENVYTTFFMKEEEKTTGEGLVFEGEIKADANVFKTLNINWDEITKWGEWGSAELKARVGITKPSLEASAKLSLFQQEVADAKMKVMQEEFSLEANVGLDLKVFILEMKGKCGVAFGVDTGKIQFGGKLEGSLKCNLLNVDLKGQVAQDIGYYFNDKKFIINIEQGGTKYSLWYDIDGNLLTGEKFGMEKTKI